MKEYIVHAPKTKVMAVEEYTSFYGEPVEELIRCRDCKFYRRKYCFAWESDTEVDGYCYLAERKEE